jgi:hypothetical protein
MEKSIESIWEEGFLASDALVAPKLNNLYNQKSIHIVDKFKRMYSINIKAIIAFAILVIPFTYITNMPYMGIPMSLVFISIVFYSSKFKKKLSEIDSSVDSYNYLKSFKDWVTEMVTFNTKMSRYLYPTIFISMLIGFWFGDIGGDVPGEGFVNWLLVDYPNMIIIMGIPLWLILGSVVAIFLLAYFGGIIGRWDLNLVYGRILKKLDRLLVEMEELRK